MRVVRKNRWARIMRHMEGVYTAEASGPRGWIIQSDYTNWKKAQEIYRKLSDRSDFKKKRGGR